ncbi:MAG: transcription elongation factor GreA [Candidatus Nealsonbacteria bacterium]|nr:transcription elongation factor GreA [Candidatus Nealsonbacteria bacterium]
MEPKYLTPEGLKKLKEELKYLRESKRKEIAERLEKCIAFGDLSENAEYHETKEEQGFVEGRILELESLINNAIVAPASKQGNFAQIGSTVLVSSGPNEETFQIVGTEEGNPMERKISIDSPLGKALVNQQKGAMVAVETPGGKIRYKILKIE